MQAMIAREARRHLLERLKHSPAVALLGPRQCGKTTLARSLGGRYFDLEQEDERLKLDLQWNDLAASRELLVLDEAQECPEIFARLRGAIDKDRKRNGRFLLLGSVSPALMTSVSESLAGRLALMELTPFMLLESRGFSVGNSWMYGGYPDGGALDPSAYPRWQNDYLTLLAQRDLPHWGLPAKPQVTMRLLRMLAAVHGQEWNGNALGASLDLSYKTVASYVDYLEGAFLIRRLAPYSANIRKRLKKKPKVYWRDTGLLHALLNVADADALLSQPWVGASWEGYVIEQIINRANLLGVNAEYYHFRTSDRKELDLVMDLGKELWALEVKLTSAPSRSDYQVLEKTAGLIGATRSILISQTRESVTDGSRTSCSLKWFLKSLADGA